MKIDLDELQRLVDAATPGPWSVQVQGTQAGVAPMRWLARGFNGAEIVSPATSEPNLRLISAMHNAMPAMLAELRAARELRAKSIDVDNTGLEARKAADELRDAAREFITASYDHSRAMREMLETYDKAVKR